VADEVGDVVGVADALAVRGLAVDDPGPGAALHAASTTPTATSIAGEK
jgi:hypothetical protein